MIYQPTSDMFQQKLVFSLLLFSRLIQEYTYVYALSAGINEKRYSSRIINRIDLRDDIGFTSLAVYPLPSNGNNASINEYIVASGSKRGTVEYFTLQEVVRSTYFDNVEDKHTTNKGWIDITNRKYFDLSEVQQNCCNDSLNHFYRPYPLYSLGFLVESSESDSVGKDKRILVIGGGDRYLTFLSCGDIENIKIDSVMGPHTGWVKDIYIDLTTQYVHSIGCNCIETWSKMHLEWTHLAKRKIESSLEGSTLSSDLLCLCSGPKLLDDSLTFFSGGVDGRIHQWNAEVECADPLYSIPAHMGRVTCLSYSNIAGFLLSASHDGTLQCRYLQDCPLANINNSVSIDIGSNQRISSIELLEEDKDRVRAILGTVTGSIILLEVEKDSADQSLRVIPKSELIEIVNGESIYKLKSLKKIGSSSSILIAHSVGLSIVQISF